MRTVRRTWLARSASASSRTVAPPGALTCQGRPLTPAGGRSRPARYSAVAVRSVMVTRPCWRVEEAVSRPAYRLPSGPGPCPMATCRWAAVEMSEMPATRTDVPGGRWASSVPISRSAVATACSLACSVGGMGSPVPSTPRSIQALASSSASITIRR
ncbi:hypothetical protein DP939_00575 [Spongiactinospora rosea]|uniref:Uncharacterized protein n=1 Tax=Spongiactinospora rosea TaxID=2248750 RepID=A0A366M6A6_9ACTN|nr:hypothetical protein DP939_00575 [Spongiactinospora rosea]